MSSGERSNSRTAPDDYSVTRVRETLSQTLRGYIEAQYHVRNVAIIRERARLLEEVGSVAQRPYVEATPVYQTGTRYADLRIPAVAQNLLSELARLDPGVGIYERPYVHQARALEAFLGHSQDLVVATGTGSGKTESFLMPILGQLAVEGATTPVSARRPAVRALLLYPMNALVADQLTRVRKLFGDPRVAASLERLRGRRVRFATYTSRTPFPGVADTDRITRHIRPLFERFFLRQRTDGTWEENAYLRDLLQPRGKWPCKDLIAFFGQRGSPWNRRLRTQPGDTELLTRHEVQAAPPDLLITNYSMLEYMLLRPIERTIFSETRAWLASDPSTIFILVLDEAHTYRGSGGAEVALLIRRLRARLGIPRERFRCILTSASLGDRAEDRERVVQFAQDLTGLPPSSRHTFSLAEGVREGREGRRCGTVEEAQALASFDLSGFQHYALGTGGHTQAATAVSGVAAQLAWPSPGAAEDLERYLFDQMTGFGPAEELIATISGRAIEFNTLAAAIFPTASRAPAERATDVLLALATFARRRINPTDDGRVLMPSRLHLFFRGLPAQYACSNPQCAFRRVTDEGGQLLGRLYTQPLLNCDCGSRTYELLTHRRCGTAFLRGYLEGQAGTFLWHEPSGLIGSDDFTTQLCAVELLVEPPHPEAVRRGEVVESWLDTRTGGLSATPPGNAEGWMRGFLPDVGANPDARKRVFNVCPVCRRGWRTRSQIMDLVTKGEAPFSNLVKAQVLAQPARRPESAVAPNGGRKSLLFSDGRQKAARLARDIPREVEQDSFRQALALAVLDLHEVGREPRPTTELYMAFVAAADRHHLAFFEREDQRSLLTHCREFHDDYQANLRNALNDPWNPNPIPGRFREALLRQLCSQFYSLSSTTLGFVGPSTSSAGLPLFARDIAPLFPTLTDQECLELAGEVAVAWIARLLEDDIAFDADYPDSIRDAVAGFPVTDWGSDGRLPDGVRTILSQDAQLTAPQAGQLESSLRQRFCSPPHQSKYRLNPGRLRVVVDLTRSWWQCRECTNVSPVRLLGRCIHCGANNVVELFPTSDYIRSRKGFWRDALQSILDGRTHPAHICAEEHTAQLSHRDEGTAYATAENHELRFQDIVVSPERDEGPVDVLSCTTTMEVGVDIGDLVAIGLRNVPPQRENYQQRAGRAGRRGSSVSTVITYAQGGPHDNHYFLHPAEIVSGRPRQPVVHTNNARIAARHVTAFLIQTFFHETLDRGVQPPGGTSGALDMALGQTRSFLLGAAGQGFTHEDFRAWAAAHVLNASDRTVEARFDWLPPEVADTVPLAAWVRNRAQTLLIELDQRVARLQAGEPLPTDTDQLLDYLFEQGLLPSYAFPTDLASFVVESVGADGRIHQDERPQLAINQALSEYAPGRLVVIDKVTYRSGGVAASVPQPTDANRARPLFNNLVDYVSCQNCSFVGPPTLPNESLPAECPLCRNAGSLFRTAMITPEIFNPEEARPVSPTDRDQDFSYASSAQFPVPVDGADVSGWGPYRAHAELTYAQSQPLVVVNRGDATTNAGFWVCAECGAAALADGPPPQHPRSRPYLVQHVRSQSGPGLCRGQYRQVFLGHRFNSDLMLLRVTLDRPFARNTADRVFRCALEDAMLSLSEALLLGASRELDIDAAEFSPGFRLWHPTGDGRLRIDIYLFDTLSGGAGYAEEAGAQLDAVLSTTAAILASCNCETSCQECLRHYGNRIHHERLDRGLASQLLAYVLDGNFPSTGDIDRQSAKLQSMQRMFELDGFTAVRNATHHGTQVPLLVHRGGPVRAVAIYPGLLDPNASEFDHPLTALDGSPNTSVSLVSEYRLTRNLPGAYQQVRHGL